MASSQFFSLDHFNLLRPKPRDSFLPPKTENRPADTDSTTTTPQLASLPTSWKVAIGINAVVLTITLIALCLLAWYIRRQYKLRRVSDVLKDLDEGRERMKMGFGMRTHGHGHQGHHGHHGYGYNKIKSNRTRSWSYDPEAGGRRVGGEYEVLGTTSESSGRRHNTGIDLRRN